MLEFFKQGGQSRVEFVDVRLRNMADGAVVDHIAGMWVGAVLQVEGPRFDAAHEIFTGGIEGGQEHADEIFFAIAGGNVEIEQIFIDVVIVGGDPVMFFDDIAVDLVSTTRRKPCFSSKLTW